MVEEVPGLELAGCRREAERAGRGGGGMSVFFGDVGRPFCLVMRLGFTGEGGPGAAVAGFGVVDGVVDFVVAVVFNGLGRTKLCRRAATVDPDEDACSNWEDVFCGGRMPRSGSRVSWGFWSREEVADRPSRMGNWLLSRDEVLSLLVGSEDGACVDEFVAGVPFSVLVRAPLTES